LTIGGRAAPGLARGLVLAFGLALTTGAGSAIAPALAAEAVAAGPSLPPPKAFATTEGRRLVTADGQALRLRCINLGHWLLPEGYMLKFRRANTPRKIEAAVVRLVGPADAGRFWRRFRAAYVAREDIALIRRLGFNAVRVPLHYRLLMDEDGQVQPDGEGFRLLDELVAWSREEGLLVLFDLHGAPGGQTGVNHDDGPGYPLLFYVRAYQDATVRLWQAVARRYRDEPAVLGYDLLNEPVAPFHDTAYLNSRLTDFYRRLVTAIRAVDPDHLIVLGGSEWNGNFSVFPGPLAGNTVYSYHKYWSKTERAAIQPYLDFSFLHNVPLFMGESGEADDDWTGAFRELHERHDIGWCFWNYKNMAPGPTVAAVSPPDGWPAIIAAADGGRRSGAAEPVLSPRQAKAILDDYLENIRLANCTLDHGFLRALGLPLPAASR
jgi:hypothetical protein